MRSITAVALGICVLSACSSSGDETGCLDVRDDVLALIQQGAVNTDIQLVSGQAVALPDDFEDFGAVVALELADAPTETAVVMMTELSPDSLQLLAVGEDAGSVFRWGSMLTEGLPATEQRDRVIAEGHADRALACLG